MAAAECKLSSTFFSGDLAEVGAGVAVEKQAEPLRVDGRHGRDRFGEEELDEVAEAPLFLEAVEAVEDVDDVVVAQSVLTLHGAAYRGSLIVKGTPARRSTAAVEENPHRIS